MSRRELGSGPRTQPPCAADPSKWELDGEGEHLLGGWVQAINTCIGCPFQDGCREELDRAYPEWWDGANTTAAPRDIIWAGWAFGSGGTLLTERGLRRLASERRQAARKSRIAEFAAAAAAAGQRNQDIAVKAGAREDVPASGKRGDEMAAAS